MGEIPASTATPLTEGYTELQDEDNRQQRLSGTGPAHVPSPSSTSPRPKGIRRTLSYNKKLIVFASSSKYEWLIGLLVATPLLAIIASIIYFDVKSQEQYMHSSKIWLLSWCFILIAVIYMAVLPRQVDVRSSGTVAIKTCLLTFHIDDIARAYCGYNTESEYDSCFRPRVKFATSLNKDGAVVIRRHHGKWDVIVTPQDPEGFVHAVEEVLRQNDHDENYIPVGGRKQSKF